MHQDSDAVASREPFVTLKPAIGPHLATRANRQEVELNAKSIAAQARAERMKERLANEARIAQRPSQPSSAERVPMTARAKKKTHAAHSVLSWLLKTCLMGPA